MPKTQNLLTIPPFGDTDVFTIVGKRGCGKTTISQFIQSHYPRVWVFDSLSEYSDGEIIFTFPEFCEAVVRADRQEKYRYIIRSDINSPFSEAEFNEMLYCLYELMNCQIVIEEAQNYSSPHYLPEYLKHCLLTGRHQNLSLVFTTQRPAVCNNTVLSQFNHFFGGSLHVPADVKYSRDMIGDEALNLPQLQKREFLYFCPDVPMIDFVTLKSGRLRRVNP